MSKRKFVSILVFLSVFTLNSRTQWVSLNSGTSMNLNCIQFINTQTGFVVGNGSAFRKTTDGGITWTALDPFGAMPLNAVFFFDSNTGLICGNSGTIIKTTDGGYNFTTINSGTSNSLFGMTFFNNNSGVCCGNSGTILYTSNGGDNWQIGNPTGYLVTFYSALMINASTGYSVGVNTIFSPLVAKTSNGGLNWTYSSFMVNNNEATLYGIHFFDSQNGITVSNLWNGQGGISSTTNAGLNWTSQIFTYGLFGLDFPAQSVGFCVGFNGCILKSTDAGNNWAQQISWTSANLRSVDFIDSLVGYTAGSSGTILKTTNGGLTGLNPISSSIPKKYTLYQNYPNPFNPKTKIKFDVPVFQGEGVVRLSIYDLLGREVTTLVNENLYPGTYEVDWNASNFASGIYLYKLKSEYFTNTKRMVLVK